MASDRARLSLDLTRQYRGVVKQQGRVTLEADDNEAFALADENLRAETLDIIGVTGTPDDGYEISPGPTQFDFRIRRGTLYVGGVRVTRAGGIYSDQATEAAGDPTDWRDHEDDPLWVEPDQGTNPVNELVYLLMREQEVGAVEDTALLDAAIGVDTAQRLRILQRIVRFGTNATDCEDAREALIDFWQAQGLNFDKRTMRLRSAGRLKVAFEDDGTTSEPCEPEAHGGYLGADNQLIRVQVSAPGKLVWGYDNASFLYRVKVIDKAGGVIELQSNPVDSDHHPRAGQAVEFLRTAATLGEDDCIAAHTGVIRTLGQAPYNPDTRQLTLPGPVPDIYADEGATPVLFLRMWEQELPFVRDTEVALAATGLRVTLSNTNTFHPGDYWMFAARPTTSTILYPQRYLDGEQPPEGPRLWVNPLAVIVRNDGDVRIEDCREHFDNLVELTKRRQGCCTVTVGDGKTSKGTFDDIQDAVDAVAKMGGGCICILAGHYELRRTVEITSDDICISGCCDAHIETDGRPAFRVTGARRVSLETLEILARGREGAVVVEGGREVRIVDCDIDAFLDQGTFCPAVVVKSLEERSSREVTLDGNKLRGIPAAALQAQGLKVQRNQMTLGGVWLREGTIDVLILENEIERGESAGVLLGGLMTEEKPAFDAFGISDVEIRDNLIRRMRNSGNIAAFVILR